MNKTILAERIGVEPRAVLAYEAGEYAPKDDVLARVSHELRFPVEFFFGPDLHEPAAETVSFRSMSRMSAAQRYAALGAGAIAFMLNDWIEEKFQLPVPDVLDLRDEEPEAAAGMLRQHWGLGERSIKNMVHLLEAKGVRVYSLMERNVEVDAFSLWRQCTPFVFLNTQKSAEQSRFDAAHELGHLVLHRHGGPRGQEAERQAHAFASAFLMPRGSVLALAPRLATLAHVIKLKKHWIVSAAALVVRLHAVGLLTDWHYRTLCIEISQRGFRKKEPEGAPREQSEIIEKVLTALRAEGMSKSDIANALNIDVEELDSLVFGLVITALGGGGVTRTPRRGQLRVVK